MKFLMNLWATLKALKLLPLRICVDALRSLFLGILSVDASFLADIEMGRQSGRKDCYTVTKGLNVLTPRARLTEFIVGV